VGAGRPITEEGYKKITTTVSLSQWVLLHLAQIDGNRSEKVEAALIAHFKLKE